jgi:hypothetical protein
MESKTENYQGVATTYNNAMRFIKIVGAVSLVLAPLLSFIGWAIAHDSIASFLNLNFTWKPTDGTTKLTPASDPALLFRYYLLPHYFIYTSFPFYIGLAITLMYKLYKKAPWHSFIGVIFSIVGAVYFIGVLGAFLSIPIGTVMITSILKISFALCVLVFVGNIVQGFALLKTDILAKWQSILFIVGNMLILIFPGTENWMALGSLFIMIALLPLSIKILKRKTLIKIGAK